MDEEKSRFQKIKELTLGALALGAIGYFIADWSLLAERVMNDWFQWAFLFCALTAFFLYGAKEKEPIRAKTLLSTMLLSAFLLFVFAFVTEGRGCSRAGSYETDCRPAGPGIYNDC